jgi:protein-tyrosine phosphatase
MQAWASRRSIESASGSLADLAAGRERHLAWDGCLNVRDLGGHPTGDGGATRFGSIVRADSIRQLSEAGWEELVDYGVVTIVDLRGGDELAADPPAELPVHVVHVPFFTDDEEAWAEIEAAGTAAPSAAAATRDVYLVFLERFRVNVAAAVVAVAWAPSGTVLVHCVGGKDRTGLLTALLLRLAGVGHADIAADYALSEQRLRPRHDAWLAEAETEEERQRIRRISATPAEAMTGVLEELERRYGSVEAYLQAGGVMEAELDRIRERLVA